ncbi:hypothetical protein Vadar_016191 [Vaccinium darrowii]|uniref:Uncharacterized protein n=1 Tax=Vaccinium darrowii TaxID=229202 RepID=A0ACB7X199_9ERIC|nr:hypothetical protein Vadar_016191 [Vaccinium darrowii]
MSPHPFNLTSGNNVEDNRPAAIMLSSVKRIVNIQDWDGVGSGRTRKSQTQLKTQIQLKTHGLQRQCIRISPPFTRLEHYKLFIDTGEEDNTFDEYLEIPFPLKSRFFCYFSLLGYVKGLFCVFEHDRSKIFFWNPSIRKSISLPKPGITEKTHGSFEDYLGFGFDSRANDYKVVRVVSLSGTKPSEVVEVPVVEVYSLDVGTWKASSGAADSFPLGFRLVHTGWPSACLEGAIHFTAWHRRNWSARLICSFDLGDEVFKTMSLPNGLSNGEIRTTVFRGLLSLLCHGDSDQSNKFCTVWIMKEYGVVDSWYKYVKVDLTGGLVRVIGIRNNGHILLDGDKPGPCDWDWELSSYDPWIKEIKKLGIDGFIGRFHVDTYEENLILLNKTDVPVSRMGGKRKRKDR